MLNTNIALFLGLAVFGVSTSSGPEAAPTRYNVEMTVSDRGEVIASPRLVTTAGEPARMKFDGKDGSRIDMSLTASPAAPGKIAVRSDILTTAANGVVRKSSPMLVVAEGELGTIEYGSVYEGKGAPVRDLKRIQFRVRALADGA
jgi:hypothetical protein